MVAAISSQQQQRGHGQNHQTRPPLLPSSEKPIPSIKGVSARKPRGKQVSSRYMSPSPSHSSSTSSSSSSAAAATKPTHTTTATLSSSRRFPSPLLSRSANSSNSPSATPLPVKRAVSADRRRPAPTNAAEMSAAAKLLVTSTRSLSVSFQGEAFSLPISKTKSPSTPSAGGGSARKATPERRRASTPSRAEKDHHSENSRPWPAAARPRQLASSPAINSLTRSVDFGPRAFGSVPVVVRALQHSLADESARRASFDGYSELTSDLSAAAASDSDSASSGGSGGVSSRPPPRGLMVSAKFWQETNSRLRRLQDPGGSPLRVGTPARFSQPMSSSPRTAGSPVRGAAARPASPSKMWAPGRGVVSPSRGRSGGGSPTTTTTTPPPQSILSFSVDVRRGKIGEDRILEAHMLRLLYNRYLQWRFVNARANSTFMLHKLSAEKNLWNAWVTISELRHSVTLKRIKLLLLRQKLKLTSIIKGQITNLEDWALLDRDHSNSLLGATEALKASTLRLPVGGKTVADIQKLKDAVSSAVDVMQAMGISICSLTVKVEDMNSVVAELVKVTGKEQILLEQCKGFLSTLAAMQVKDCSLRTHIIQFNRIPTTSSLTTRV